MMDKPTAEKVKRELPTAQHAGIHDLSSFSIDRVNCHSIDPLLWLSRQEKFPQFYWRDSERDYECAAAGAAIAFSEDSTTGLPAIFRALEFLRSHPQKDKITLTGGMAFSSNSCSSPLWSSFPTQYFFLPQLLLERDGSNFSITFAGASTSPLLQGELTETTRITTATPSLTTPPYQLARSFTRSGESSARQEWNALIGGALDAITAQEFTKVVLARRTQLHASSTVPPYTLLQSLFPANSRGIAFAFQPVEGETFLGLSPECLFRLYGSHLEADSLGGTIGVGKSEEENRLLRAKLLSDQKLLHEHYIVTQDIKHKLLPLTDSVLIDGKPHVLTLSSVQHLRSKVSGTLRRGISAGELLTRLHPTAAVCGHPGEKARRFIEEHEGFKRGWYSGPIGIITENYTEFRVGIRSLLAQHGNLSVFAGAGIVAGSEADVEYEELERKAHPIFSKLLAIHQ